MCALVAATGESRADPVPRAGATAGSVIARKAGEEARLIEVGDWRNVDLRQDLLPGDTLRTNATGALAILFSDRTQVRLGRNSTLVVRSIGGAGEDSRLELQAGALWARAERGGDGVVVDTPAAAAAIRGTDWAMQVQGATTSLTVLEGQVELANPQGSVLVTQGQAASATVGQAPTRVIITTPKDREQQLNYLSARSVFVGVPTTRLSGAAGLAEVNRIRSLPEGRRSTEEEVTLAEVIATLEGIEAERAAVARARMLPLSPAQRARLDLLDAQRAGAEGRYGEAAELYASAMPRLDPERKAVARFGGFVARSLADPDRNEAPPSAEGGGPAAAFAQAVTVAFLDGLPAALEIIHDAEARFPREAGLPAIRAQIALTLDDRDQAREAVARALAIDPDDAAALEARASLRASYEGDLDGAEEDLRRAVEIAPGSSSAWNTLGLVQAGREANREAEAAFRRSIALDPNDPVGYANLAVFLLEQDRVAEARPLIDRAMALDPAFDVALAARGRLRLQTGELDAAVSDLLAASTANPAYSQGLLLLAAGLYESGDRVGAEQALDNAERLDPNDPVTPNFETAIAIDGYDSDRAIASAQEGLRRARLRGGDYAAVSANRTEGSTLNDAYRLQGLDAWGRYYGAATFDPFSATALTDQSVAGSPDPFVNELDFGGATADPTFNNGTFSAFFQGLLLDPAILASRSRGANLLRRPFVEATLGGGFVAPRDEPVGWTTSVEAQGFAASPFPISVYGAFTGQKNEDEREGGYSLAGTPADVSFTLENEDFSGIGYIAAKPTPNDRVVAYVDVRQDIDVLGDYLVTPALRIFDERIDLDPDPDGVLPADFFRLGSAAERRVEDRSLTSGLAWSHTFGYRNVASAAVFASGFERSSDTGTALAYDVEFVDPTTGGPLIDPDTGLPFTLAVGAVETVEGEYNQTALTGALSHMISFGDLTARYGVEGGRVAQEERQTTSRSLFFPGGSLDEAEGSAQELTFLAARPYLDLFFEASPTLTFEAGLFGTFLRSQDIGASITSEGLETEIDVDGISISRAEPRAGFAWAPADGQWLRFGYMREAGAFSAGSLAPVGVVGLQSNQLPLSVTGYSDTFAARWEAEWTSRFFTVVDAQHQEFEGLNIPEPAGITTADIAEGSLDRVSATANFHLGGGFGLFGTYVWLDSENEGSGPFQGDPLPFVPEDVIRTGITYVSPANLKVTVAATRVGERQGALGGGTLDSYWTADAFLTWEPFEKRFALELAGCNLLDEDFDAADNLPGYSRTFTGSLKVRF
ncbi:MAG: TonB-dependent receptor [Mesorhizobium amorphae]|nr:MAG: TonB-dependent receptor [Mesorhizobium amorphae]